MWRHTDSAGIAAADYRASVLGTEDIVAVGAEAVVDNQGCTTGIPPAVVEAKGLMQRYRGSGCVQGQNRSRTGCWTIQLESCYTCLSIVVQDERAPRQSC
jgi:hypothetical protein